jgi:hypothetical protein
MTHWEELDRLERERDSLWHLLDLYPHHPQMTEWAGRLEVVSDLLSRPALIGLGAARGCDLGQG